MKKFEDRSDGGMYITENQAQIHLAPHEAYALWRWLSARKGTFPDQHELGPIVNALDPGWEPVTERALQLHKEFQAQYHVHPLLEDDSTYAQG
jgi:glycine/D-amino acid oxidase-like deaminating enzyme